MVEPQTPDATRPWRETRDDAYQLVLARRYRAALPMLRTARAGARLAQRDGAASAAERESALIDELNILVRMVACHHDGADLPGLLSALRDAVGVHHDLAGRAHLAAVTREQTNVVLSGLTGVLESWRARLVDEAGRIDLLDASADVFESLADVFAAVGRPDAALAAAERGRARTFADLLVARRDPAGEEPTDGELTGGADVLGVHDLCAAVADYGATVVEYLLGDQGGWAWVITPVGRIGAARLTVTRARLTTMAGALSRAHENGEGGEDGGRALLAELYEELIRPLPAELLPPAGSPLAVVPHGDLFGIPFAVLFDGARGEYLHERYALVTLPSIGTIPAAGLGRVAPARPGSLLAVANPPFEHLVDDERPTALRALPDAEAALPTFARLLPPGATRGFAGTQATFARLGEARPGELLLLATHGVADFHNPSGCFLAFAEGPGHDGRARIREIAALPLDSPLVVLLSCWTAAGRVTSDGVLGLNRAFLLAGSTSVLAGLWTVGEITGTQVVYRMLAGWLRDGCSRAEALRRAQVSLAGTLPGKPLRWSVLQLTGAWR